MDTYITERSTPQEELQSALDEHNQHKARVEKEYAQLVEMDQRRVQDAWVKHEAATRFARYKALAK